MPTAIHRTTGEIRTSANETEHPSRDWIINPRLPGSGTPRDWVIEGDDVRLMTSAELAARDQRDEAARLALLKQDAAALFDPNTSLGLAFLSLTRRGVQEQDAIKEGRPLPKTTAEEQIEQVRTEISNSVVRVR